MNGLPSMAFTRYRLETAVVHSNAVKEHSCSSTLVYGITMHESACMGGLTHNQSAPHSKLCCMSIAPEHMHGRVCFGIDKMSYSPLRLMHASQAVPAVIAMRQNTTKTAFSTALPRRVWKWCITLLAPIYLIMYYLQAMAPYICTVCCRLRVESKYSCTVETPNTEDSQCALGCRGTAAVHEQLL